MGANLYWEPTARRKHDVNVGARSSFIDSMRRAFGGDSSWSLCGASIPTLTGMSAAYGEDNKSNPYEQLLDAIDKHGSIRVWAEY